MSEQSDEAFEAWMEHSHPIRPHGFWAGEKSSAKAGWDAAVAYQKARDLLIVESVSERWRKHTQPALICRGIKERIEDAD